MDDPVQDQLTPPATDVVKRENGPRIMGRTKESNASLLIASDSTFDATLIQSQLEDEFEHIKISVDAETGVDEFQSEPPDVLVLAFREIANSEQFYLGLFRLTANAQTPRHRAIVLCTQQQAGPAYELCRRGLFDDYVVFWPHTYDATRLPMSIHRAIKELAMCRGAAQVVASTGEGQLSSSSSADPAQAHVTTEAAQLGSTIRRQTVLVVDDDVHHRELAGRILQSDGLNVDYAASADQALDLLRSTRPDLILVDYMMPDMNGLDLMQRLSADSELAEIPIIVITGSGERGLVQTSVQAGAVDFVLKPWDRSTLITKVRRVLNLGSEQQTPARTALSSGR